MSPPQQSLPTRSLIKSYTINPKTPSSSITSLSLTTNISSYSSKLIALHKILRVNFKKKLLKKKNYIHTIVFTGTGSHN